MLLTSQNIPSLFIIYYIFIICFDIKLANTAQQRSTGGLWSNALNKSKHHFEETMFFLHI